MTQGYTSCEETRYCTGASACWCVWRVKDHVHVFVSGAENKKSLVWDERTVTHWDEMRKGNHILAFSDSVEKQILHTGHQSASTNTNKTNRYVSFALRARSCASSLMSTTFSKEKTLASIQVWQEWVGKQFSFMVSLVFFSPPNTISLRL